MIALASVLLQFLTVVGEAGVTSYVVQYEGEDWREEARAAFWMNFVITTVQVAACLAFAPLLPLVFDQQQLLGVFAALLVIFFIRQATIVQEAVLRRELRYKTLAVRDVLCTLSASALAMALAVRGFGVWSLVLPNLLIEPVRFGAVTLAGNWSPGLRMLRSRWRRIFRYSKHLMAATLLQTTINEGDSVVVGRSLGSTELGYYNLAWQLSNFVGKTVTGVVSDVSLPALAASRRSDGDIGGLYLRLARLLATIGAPLLGLLFVYADDVVDLLYGEGYQPVVGILRVLIAFTAVRIFTTPSGTAFSLIGRTDLTFKASLATAPFYLFAVVIGARWGVIGVAAAVAAVRSIGAVAVFLVSTRLLQIPTWKVLASLGRIIALAVVASLIAAGVSAGTGLPDRAYPLSGVVAGAAGYLLLLRVFSRGDLHEVALLVTGLARAVRPAQQVTLN